MRRKYVIFGLVLLVAGSGTLVWGLADKRAELHQASEYKRKHALETQEFLRQYGEWLQTAPGKRPAIPWGMDESGQMKPGAQLRQEQRERLKADLDKLATGEGDVHPFADILYGANWRQEVEKYKGRKETRELFLTLSIVCMLAGGAVFACLVLAAVVQRVIIVCFVLKQFVGNFLRRRRRARGKSGSEGPEEKSLLEELDFDEPRELVASKRNSGGGRAKQSGVRGGSGGTSGREGASGGRKIAMLMKGDASFFDAGAPLKTVMGRPDRSNTGVGVLERGPNLADLREERAKLEDSLKTQAENLEKHMEEFKRMTESVQQKALENSGPLKDGLTDLTEQIAAIRDYAASQQGRVEKLQNGYDWNIIRNFCVRVIRCIDGVEERIARLEDEGAETSQLEEVRDELIFALESSGLERFEPELNSEYRGQEKWAEAVKEREESDKAKMSGKIAEVLRPGYRYIIDEENIKVVRTAQVKLFA
jgi:molecular chaperone GrpE (heat shock protein)